MADFYISTTGSNTSPYDTWGKAANSPATIAALGTTGGPHRIFIKEGQYTSAVLSLTTSNWVSALVFGVSATGVAGGAVGDTCLLFPSSIGAVTLSRSGTVLNFAVANITAKNIESTTNGFLASALTLSGDSFTGDRLYIHDASNLLSAPSSATNIKISRSIFSGGTGDTPLNFGGSSSGELNNCIFKASNTRPLSTGAGTSAIKSSSSGDITLNNPIIQGYDATALLKSTGAGKLTAKNIIMGPPRRQGEVPIVKTTVGAGALSIINGCLSQDTSQSHYLFGGVDVANIIDTNNIKTIPPYIKHHKKMGYIIPEIDGVNESGTYAIKLKNALSSRGMKGTWYITVGSQLALSQTYRDQARSFLDDPNRTMSIGVHGYSHNPFDASGAVWTGGITGGTSIDINRSLGTITVVGSPGGIITDFRNKSLKDIKILLQELGCVVGAFAFAEDIAMGEWLADSGGAQSIPYVPQILVGDSNQGRLWSETSYAKGIMTSLLNGYVAKTFATPYGAYNTGSNNAIAAAGFIGNRNWVLTSNLWTDKSVDLSNIDLINGTFRMASTDLVGSTPTETIRNSHAFAEWVAEHGLLVHMLQHDTTEVSEANLGLILDALGAHSDVIVTSADDAYDQIKNNGLWTTADGRNYTREWNDLSDYHLQPTSPCIGAGTAISGITTDIEGNQLYPPYNIGPYGAVAGALEVSPTTNPGSAKLNITCISGTSDTVLVSTHTYSLADSNQIRTALGWTWGVDHWAYTDVGVPKVITGATILANGIGPNIWANDNQVTILA